MLKILKYLLIAGLVFWVLVQGNLPKGPDVGIAAPTFNLVSTDGRSFSSKALRGKTVVLDFWATWCPACIASLPALDAFYRNHRDGDHVEVISIHVPKGANLSRVKQFNAKHRYSFPVVLDMDAQLVSRFQIESIPTVIVIAPDGRVHFVKNGQLRGYPDEGAAQLKDWVDAATSSVLIQ